MRKQGFTLIEVLVTVAIIGIVLLIFNPLMNSFIGSQERLQGQSQVDSRLNEVVDFIKRDVRNAKETTTLAGEPLGVYDNDTDNNLITNGETGTKVVINAVDLGTGDSKVLEYFLDGSDLKLRTTSRTETILDEVEELEFQYKERILLFRIKIRVSDRLDGKVRNEIRDVAITRINLQ